DPPPPPIRKPSRWLWWLLLVLLVGFAALVVAWLVGTYRDQQYLAVVMAELDRTDPGWRWEEIEAGRHRLPTEGDGARNGLKADELLPGPWPSNAFYEAFSPNGDSDFAERPAALLDEKRVALLRKELTSQTSALAEIRRLVDYPNGRYSVQMGRNPMMILL